MKKFLRALTLALPLFASPAFAQVGELQTSLSSVAWTSATSVDSTLEIPTLNLCTVTVTLITTSTMTAGSINFEFSKDATTFMPMHAVRMLGQNSEAVYSLATPPENRGWQANVCATRAFRVRLNPAITGSGTATISIAASSGSSNGLVTVTQANPALLNTTTTPAVGGNGVVSSTTERVVLAQGATYSAATTAKTATTSGTGPFFSICGSATKTIRIQQIYISGTIATTAVYGDVQLRVSSTATSAGTSTTLTQVPHDSTSAAGTATNVKFYTALGTGGTLVGNIASMMSFFPVTGTAANMPAPLEFKWRDTDSQSPVLRGTGQCIEAGFGTAPGTAPTLQVSVKWTEE